MESSLNQLCRTVFQTSGFSNAEEKGHLTFFSKNIEVQNFIFTYLIFSWTKEKKASSRVKMFCIYMLVFFHKKLKLQRRRL